MLASAAFWLLEGGPGTLKLTSRRGVQYLDGGPPRVAMKLVARLPKNIKTQQIYRKLNLQLLIAPPLWGTYTEKGVACTRPCTCSYTCNVRLTEPMMSTFDLAQNIEYKVKYNMETELGWKADWASLFFP